MWHNMASVLQTFMWRHVMWRHHVTSSRRPFLTSMVWLHVTSSRGVVHKKDPFTALRERSAGYIQLPTPIIHHRIPVHTSAALTFYAELLAVIHKITIHLLTFPFTAIVGGSWRSRFEDYTRTVVFIRLLASGFQIKFNRMLVKKCNAFCF